MSKLVNRTYLAVACLGGIIIVAGNGISSAAASRGLGLGLRQLGLSICVLTGIVFLFHKNAARMRKAGSWLSQQRPRSLPEGLRGMDGAQQFGPSPLLISIVRLYCIALFLVGLYWSGMAILPLFWYGPFRAWSPWLLLTGLASVFVVICPAFLLWNMTDAVVRMDFHLGALERRLRQLEAPPRIIEAESVDGDSA